MAGPWMQPAGGYYARFAVSYLYTGTEFDSDGNEVSLLTSNPLVQSAAYREVDLTTYVEFGISRHATLVASLPYKILTSRRTEITDLADLMREVDVTNAGFSDLYIGIRAPIRRGRYPVSAELAGKAPVGYSAAPSNGGPALGTGHADLTASLLAGVAARSVYASASATYRVRGGPLADDAGFSAQAGGAYGRGFAQALLEGWYSTVPPEPLDVSSTTTAANQDVLKLIASIGVRTAANAALVAEIYHVIEGKNVATGTTVALALVLTHDPARRN